MSPCLVFANTQVLHGLSFQVYPSVISYMNTLLKRKYIFDHYLVAHSSGSQHHPVSLHISLWDLELDFGT